MTAETLPNDLTREQIRAGCTATALVLTQAHRLEAILVPRRYGGIGGEFSDQARVVSILAEGSPGVAARPDCQATPRRGFGLRLQRWGLHPAGALRAGASATGHRPAPYGPSASWQPGRAHRD